MDSVVLLHLLATLSKSMQLDVSAVHVEHGISAHSSQWSTFCQTLCDSLAIPLSTHRLKICKQPQKSLEALAREARYQIFRQIQADYVVLAQHQDDQVETLMLQLLRGAGIKGLSAMPTVRLFAPGKTIRLLRPLLNIPRSKIQKYAKFQKLSWVTDESNLDTSYDRNFYGIRFCLYWSNDTRLTAKHCFDLPGISAKRLIYWMNWQKSTLKIP